MNNVTRTKLAVTIKQLAKIKDQLSEINDCVEALYDDEDAKIRNLLGTNLPYDDEPLYHLEDAVYRFGDLDSVFDDILNSLESAILCNGDWARKTHYKTFEGYQY